MKYLLLLLISCSASAQILVFADPNKKTNNMDFDQYLYISKTLNSAKMALNLECHLKVREIKEERKFKDGTKIIEMLEITYHPKNYITNSPEQKVFVPVGSKVTFSQKNSRQAGIVEEIELESEDLVNSRLTLQHNGKGEVVHVSYEDDLQTLPCQIKKY